MSFDGATVRDIRSFDEGIDIYIDDVRAGARQCSVKLELRDIKNITRDGIEVDLFQMEQQDGEVLVLMPTSTGAELIIEWNNFSLHVSKTMAYCVECRAATVIA
jgi:hypothetical protein